MYLWQKKICLMDPNAYKKGLRNKLSKEQALKKLESENFFRKTLSFYRYVILENPEKFRDDLFKDWGDLDCLGRIYVAREGINAQMNVPEHHWEKFIATLNKYEEFSIKKTISACVLAKSKITKEISPQEARNICEKEIREKLD